MRTWWNKWKLKWAQRKLKWASDIQLAEIKKRVSAAYTIALTEIPHAPKANQLNYAQNLLNTMTTEELLEDLNRLRTATPSWWKGSREQWLHHIGRPNGF